MNNKLESAMEGDASDLMELPYWHLSGGSKENIEDHSVLVRVILGTARIQKTGISV